MQLIKLKPPIVVNISLKQSTKLEWPKEFFSINNAEMVFVVKIIDCQKECSLILPDATLVSMGVSFTLINSGENSFSLRDNSEEILIDNIYIKDYVVIILNDNSTPNGKWSIDQYYA